MAFNPEQEYIIVTENIHIKRFHDFKEQYIVRPPYQRKTVWNTQTKEDLLDSLFRRYFIPSIVLREVRLSKQDSRNEVIDGQQRISTVQEFFENKLRLPSTLNDVDSGLPGKLYSELHADIRVFVDFNLQFSAEIIKNIHDPDNHHHLKIASDIFWRLQQGEDLTKIEKAHARLTSLVRNFLVKYANDYDFDFDAYRDINPNPNKHIFFHQTYKGANDRMQHLGLLARFLLLECAGGPTSIQNWNIEELIKRTELPHGGVGNSSFDKTNEAKAVLKTLSKLNEVFLDESHKGANGGGVPVFAAKTTYFIFSCYLLLRHLLKHYVYSDEVRLSFRDFIYSFYLRINPYNPDDINARNFVENRQQDKKAVTERDRIIRHEFFVFALEEKKVSFVEKDKQQAFSEAQRIAIYLRDGGICRICMDNGKPENECVAPWHDFHADHIIPFSQGGSTTIDNGQVLCSVHNLQKGANYVG